jgi:hypothetical protein
VNYQGKEYKLYTSIGDERVPDGDYYVDPADGQIKFQKAYGIGSLKLPAPKASIMAALIKGLLDRKLPWSLVLLGVALALMAEILGLQVLAFAVGVYLPVSTSATLFVGSVIRRIVMERTGMTDSEADAGRGTLYASGLIAGGALAGLALAAFTAFQLDESVAIGPRLIGWLTQSNVFAIVIFSGLAYSLYRYASNRDPM